MDDEPQFRNRSEVARRKSSTSSRSSGKRGTAEAVAAVRSTSLSSDGTPTIISNSGPSPCGACKFLRRKCVSGCIFAPYFGSDRGAAKFAAVHKVFGASNVSKLLLYIPVNRRHDAVVTISYEAQARLSDPVYGCISTILALQHQVANLQAELAMVQTQLMNSRFALSNAFHGSQTIPQQQQQQQNNMISMLQPAYSNTSSVSNNNNNSNFVNMNNFNSAATGSFDLVGETVISGCFDPIHELPPTTPLEEEDEEDSHIPLSFTNQIF